MNILILFLIVMCPEGEICVFQELGWMDSDMNEMEEVIQAARSANIHQFVASLPEGYSTRVSSFVKFVCYFIGLNVCLI